MSRRCRYSR